MNKTRLGINEYFFAALIFVAAIIGPIPMFGMMLYAAVAEKSVIINSSSKIALVIKSGVVLFSSLFSFIEKIVRERGKTVIMVTHNVEIAKMADRVIKLKNVKISSVRINRHPLRAEDLSW